MAPQSPAPVKAVVADDDGACAEVLVTELSAMGLEVARAGTVDELRATLKALPKALLVVDVRFSRQNAIGNVPAWLEQARADGRSLVVVMLSNVPGFALAQEATRVGVFRYVAKPLQGEIMRIALNDALGELLLAKPPAAPAPAPAGDVGTQTLPGLQRNPLEFRTEVLGRQHKLERDAVLKHAPEESGVLTLYDKDGQPVFVEWADNLAQRLNGYVDFHPKLMVLARASRSFEMVTTADRDQVVKIFDRLVNKFGKPPSKMTVYPEGSGLWQLQERERRAAPPAPVPVPAAPPAPPAPQAPQAPSPPPLPFPVPTFEELPALWPPTTAPATASAPAPAAPAPPAAPGDGRVTMYSTTQDSKLLEGVRKVMAEDPTDPETQDWLAFTLYSNNLLDEAILWYTKLITAGSRREEHFFYCGNSFFKKGDVPRAVKMWSVSATLHPGSTIARKSRQRLDEVTAPS